MVAATSASASASAASLKEYLKRYESSGSADDQKKKKKKKKPKPNPVGSGVLVVDEDPVWQKPVQPEGIDEDADDSAEEKPQIEEDIEVKRMKRLEAIRSRKPYNAISEDGSGWVSISNPSNPSSLAAASSELETEIEEDPSGDLSRPHRARHQSQEPTEQRGPSAADLSPPRSRRDSSPDLSPPRRTRLSPPGNTFRGDLSPPRRRRRESSADLSPPRQTRGRRDTPASDLSPPRRNQKNSTGSLSLPRHHSPEALRTAGTRATDLSPPRKRKEPSMAKEKPKTGLLSAKEIKDEIDKKKKEELAKYASMDPSLSGKGAVPVFRDKEGKRISKEEILKAQEEEKPKEKKLEWGKGLAQKREAEARVQELERERDKPFARMRDDPELDKMLKERIRWGDPMAHLVKRKHSEVILEDLGDNEKMKESGFIIPQTIPNHSWIKRGLDFTPNRYGIRPGRHWDGVDRSNGYEKELFKRQSEKRATETEAYLWSVSDM